MSARLEKIWSKRARRGPMDVLERGRLVENRGLEGNTHQGGRRQVTILSREAWARAEADLGMEVDPAARRANLLVSGLELDASRGRVLAVGSTRIGILGETRPCPTMDAARPGLMAALDPEWRAGAFGVVLVGGAIAVGDEVSWAEGDEWREFDPAAYEPHRTATG